MENSAVANFREYIRIESVHPNPVYDGCVSWLKKQSEDLKAEFFLKECIPGKPIVVLTIKGEEPNLPSILLNSHMDVVPVFPEHWKYGPFSAHKDEEGNIYGRGTQDMKCVGVQYVEAVKKLQKSGVKLKRNLHLSFVPDEEIGGKAGMAQFVKTEEFRQLNVAFGLDEGIANPTSKFTIFYGERNIWQFWLHCPGQPGHASQFLQNTAGAKVQSVINSVLAFREEQENKLQSDSSLRLGDVVSVNFTRVQGGVQFNVVPSLLSVGFDIRVPPIVDLKEMEITINGWAKQAGDDVTVEFVNKEMIVESTCVEDGKNPWWDHFSIACKEEGLTIEKEIFPAGTDARYLRELGIPAIGFSPMNNTPVLLHDHNEFLNDKIFLKGIQIYATIIKHLANQV